jgi:hypothetical protein
MPTVYGIGGYDTTKPNNNVVSSTPDSPDPVFLNGVTLRAKAQTALTTNATFLAIANPTAAQVATQVKALTRETNVLLRLLLNALTDISDT